MPNQSGITTAALRVRLLGHLHDLPRPAEEHLGIRAQPRLDLGQVGRAENLGSQRAQFFVDRLEFGQPLVVDLVRREVERREVPDERLVTGAAAGKAGEADVAVRSSVRIQVVTQEVAQPRVRGTDPFRRRFPDPGPEVVPRPFRPGVESRPRRGVDRPLLDRPFEERVELDDGAVHRGARRDPARLQPGAEVRDVVVDVVCVRVPAPDHALAVHGRLQGLGPHDVEEVELEPLAVIDDPDLEIACLLRDLSPELMVEREPGQPLVRGQRREVDRGERIHEGADLAAAVVPSRRRDVADAVIEAIGAEIRGLERVPGEVRVPEAVRERRQVARHRVFGRVGRPFAARCGGPRHE